MNEIRPFLFALLLGLGLGALADELSQLPAPWAGRLQPLAEVDLSGADLQARAQMQEVRTDLARRLADPTTPTEDLAEAFGTLAFLYADQGIVGAAQTALANARALAPKDPRWPYLAGLLALSNGQLDQALADFQAVRHLTPGDPLLPLRLGQVHFERGELGQALPLLEQAAERPGSRALALYYLGQIALRRRDYPQAVEDFQETLRLTPQADRVHYPLALALRGLGETAAARRHLEQKGDHLPPVDDPLLQALRDLEQGPRRSFSEALRAIRERRYGNAVAPIEVGLAQAPNNLNARVTLARVRYLTGRPQDAREELAKVLKRDPNQVLARFFYAVLLDAAGDPEAEAEYRKVLALEPKHPGANLYLGRLLLAQGHYAQAARHFAAAAADLPQAALFRLVALGHAGHDPAGLAKALEALHHSHPEDPTLTYALIRLLALSADPRVRDPQRALALAGDLLAQGPVPAFQEARALALAANGDFAAAAQTLGEILYAFPPWDSTQADLWNRELAAVEAKHLPRPAWPLEDPLLTPRPPDPARIFEEYPAPHPF